MLKEHHTMEGLLTHVGSADCFITPPHPAQDCGIVTAWWHYQVKGTHDHTAAARGRATPAATSGTTTAFRSDPHRGLEHESDPED
jgi:hypothetical protein